MRSFIAILIFISLASAAVALPQDFQKTQLLGSGIDTPTGFDIAPDGRAFILEKDGTVKIFKNGQLLSQPFYRFSVDMEGEKGLLGMAFDPQFSSNHYAYFYYIDSSGRPTISRLDALRDTATSANIIYQDQQPSGEIHNGGTIRFGPDEKLYLAIGDNGYGPNSQNLNNVRGAVIRINSDGTIPSDNPFVGQSGAKPEIWAYGFRNPFRFAFDEQTGFLYLGDVGHNGYEEVNRITKGGNYGWPTCEGYCSNSNFINPIYAYPIIVNGEYLGGSVVAGTVYRSTEFPDGFQGSLFIGDYARGWIKHMRLSDEGTSNGVYPFEDNAGTVVDIKQGQDGSIYYLTIYPGSFNRIDYASGNKVPIAKAGADPKQGEPPLRVQFSSAGSYDPDGDNISYRWDFGDGTSSTSPNPVKEYHNKGVYIAKLTVSDLERSSTSSVEITAGTPPSVTINSPDDSALFQAGDTIEWSIDAHDSDGNTINNAEITIDLHHDDHVHPFLERSGKSGSFEIPTTGHTEHNIWYRIYAKATDQNGISTTEFVEIFPRKTDMLFDTEPGNFSVTIDGSPRSTPHTETGVENVQREISTDYINYLGKQTHIFDSWSNGGNRTQNINTPIDDTNFIANYIKADESNAFKAEYFNNQDLSGSPDLVRYDPFIAFNWETQYSPDSSIKGDHFSARWSRIVNFDEGDYRFTITADDGVRLMIDNEVVLDKWIDQPPTTYVIDRHLEAGNHTITLEYYENSERAVIYLEWKALSQESFSSNFYLSPNINQWWQEVNVVPENENTISQVYMRIYEDQWIPMEKKDWGNWAANRHTPENVPIDFFAVSNSYLLTQSTVFHWLSDKSSSSIDPTSFPAQFYISPMVNRWWSEVNVVSSFHVEKVEMSINNGEWMQMEKKSWGNWARNIEIKPDDIVQFRAFDSKGRIALSWEYKWQ